MLSECFSANVCSSYRSKRSSCYSLGISAAPQRVSAGSGLAARALGRKTALVTNTLYVTNKPTEKGIQRVKFNTKCMFCVQYPYSVRVTLNLHPRRGWASGTWAGIRRHTQKLRFQRGIPMQNYNALQQRAYSSKTKHAPVFHIHIPVIQTIYSSYIF